MYQNNSSINLSTHKLKSNPEELSNITSENSQFQEKYIVSERNPVSANSKRKTLFDQNQHSQLKKTSCKLDEQPVDDCTYETQQSKRNTGGMSITPEEIYRENSLQLNKMKLSNQNSCQENESYLILEKQFNQLDNNSYFNSKLKGTNSHRKQSNFQNSQQKIDNISSDTQVDDTESSIERIENSRNPSYLTQGAKSVVTRKSIYTRKSLKRERSRSPIKVQQSMKTDFACIKLETRVGSKMWEFTQFIKILVLVQRFIKHIGQKLKGFKQIVNLNQRVFEVLNDPTFFRDYYVDTLINKYKHDNHSIYEKKGRKNSINGKNSTKNKFCQDIKRLLNYIRDLWYKVPYIQPNQTFKILSDCWQSFWVVYRMFYTTVKLSFFIENMKESVGLIDQHTLLLINCSFIFDIMLQFHTGYYERGIIVFDKRKIAKKYIKETLLSDILAQIPLFFTYTIDDNSTYEYLLVGFILELFIFLKLVSLKQTFRRLERVITENEKAAQFFPLFTLSVQILLLAHVVGLLYHGVAVFQIQLFNEDQTWLHQTRLIEQECHTCYWAICTMVTILLYIPETNIETLFAIFSILLMCGVFGYALNTIGIIVTEFFNKRLIPPNLRERISLYLEFKYKNEMERNQEEEDLIINQLSKQLQKEVKQEINHNNLIKFDILLKSFSNDTKTDILQIIIEENYSAGELITANVSGSLYVIVQGSAVLQTQKDRHSKIIDIKQLKSGDIFGLSTFFTNQIQDYVIKSLENTILLRIDLNQFLMILQNNPDDLENFHMIKDELFAKCNPPSPLFLYQHFQKVTSNEVKSTCEICELEGHQFLECSNIHYVVNKKQMIYNYNNLDTQIRQTFQRNQIRPWHARMVMQYSKDVVDEIFSERNEEEDLYELAIFWQDFYEENIPVQDFDTNSEMEMLTQRQKSFQTKKKLSIKYEDQNTLNYSRCEKVQEESYHSSSDDSSHDIFERKSSRKKLSQKKKSWKKNHSNNNNNNNGKRQYGGVSVSSNIVIQEATDSPVGSSLNNLNQYGYRSFLDNEYESSHQNQYNNMQNTPNCIAQSPIHQSSIASNPQQSSSHQNQQQKGIMKTPTINQNNLNVNNQLSQLDPFTVSNRPRGRSNLSFMSNNNNHRTNTMDKNNGTSAFEDDRKSRTQRRNGTLMSMNTMNTYYLEQKPTLQHANTLMTNAKEKQQLQQQQRAKVKDTWDLIHFDKPKNYLVYFPWNNLDKLVEAAVSGTEESDNSDADNENGDMTKYKDFINRHMAKRKSMVPPSSYFSATTKKQGGTLISPTKPHNNNNNNIANSPRNSIKQFVQDSDKNLANMANKSFNNNNSLQDSSLQNIIMNQQASSNNNLLTLIKNN